MRIGGERTYPCSPETASAALVSERASVQIADAEDKPVSAARPPLEQVQLVLLWDLLAEHP
jgi:hypothetical protein